LIGTLFLRRKRGVRRLSLLSLDTIYGHALEPVVITPVVVAPVSVEF